MDDWFVLDKPNPNMSQAAFETFKTTHLRNQKTEFPEIVKLESKKHDIPLSDESFFISRGYPRFREWMELAMKLVKPQLKTAFEDHMRWLTRDYTSQTPMDVVLSIWLSNSCKHSKGYPHLSASEKLKLANTVWKKGPDTMLTSYNNLQHLTCTCMWTTKHGIEKIIDNYTYLKEPVVYSWRRMKNDFEKKQSDFYLSAKGNHAD